MDTRLALILGLGLALAMGAAPARAQKDAPEPARPDASGSMPGMHRGMDSMMKGTEPMPEGCMQMMQAAREQDAELERRLERMKQATAPEEKLEAMATVVETLAEQRLARHSMMDRMGPMCSGMMPMGHGTTMSAAGRPEGETYAAQGRVESVDPERGTVTIDHEDIPGLMKAMTMTFEVADRAILEDVSVGQAIDFRIRKDADRYVVTEIHISD